MHPDSVRMTQCSGCYRCAICRSPWITLQGCGAWIGVTVTLSHWYCTWKDTAVTGEARGSSWQLSEHSTQKFFQPVKISHLSSICNMKLSNILNQELGFLFGWIFISCLFSSLISQIITDGIKSLVNLSHIKWANLGYRMRPYFRKWNRSSVW